MEEQEFYRKHYARLLGKNIVGVVCDQAADLGPIFGLRLDSGEIAWILADPEGNGPGFLDIQG